MGFIVLITGMSKVNVCMHWVCTFRLHLHVVRCVCSNQKRDKPVLLFWTVNCSMWGKECMSVSFFTSTWWWFLAKERQEVWGRHKCSWVGQNPPKLNCRIQVAKWSAVQPFPHTNTMPWGRCAYIGRRNFYFENSAWDVARKRAFFPGIYPVWKRLVGINAGLARKIKHLLK